MNPSLLSPGVTPNVHWSPKQTDNLTQVQQHWIVQDGNAIPPMNLNERVRLRNVATVLFGRDPLNPIFYSSAAYLGAAQFVLEHVGIRCFKVSEDEDGHEASQQYFSFNRNLLNLYTTTPADPVGLDLDPEVAFAKLREIQGKRRYRREVERRREQGIPCDLMDHMEVWYEAGIKVVDRTGFRMPFSREGTALSPLQKLLRWLEVQPARLVLISNWAQNLSMSAVLSEMEHREEFSFHDTLMATTSVNLHVQAVTALFNLTGPGFQDLRQNVWPSLAVPLFRRARQLKQFNRNLNSTVSEAIWFGRAPVGVDSAPMTDPIDQATSVALETLKEEKRTLGELLGVEARTRRRPGQEDVTADLANMITTLDEKMLEREAGMLEIIDHVTGVWTNWNQANLLIVNPVLRSSTFDSLVSSVRPSWTSVPIGGEEEGDREAAIELLRERGEEGREEAELNGEVFVNENEDGNGWEWEVLEMQIRRIQDDPCPWEQIDPPDSEQAVVDWLAACGLDADGIAQGNDAEKLMVSISAIHSLLTDLACASPLLFEFGYLLNDGVTLATMDSLYERPLHVGSFGHQLYEFNLAAICFIRFSPELAQIWQDVDWDILATRLAVVFALLLRSDTPWLYTPMAGFVIDASSRTLADIPLNDRGLVMLSAIREYGNGCVMALNVGSKSYNSAAGGMIARHRNVFQWTKDIIYHNATFGLESTGPLGQDHCRGCIIRPRIRYPTHSYRVDDRLSRLTVSTVCIRRGIRLDCTLGVGRFEYTPCVALLMSLAYHPTFIHSFHYFADVLHQEEKIAVVKSTVFMTADGPVLGS